MKRNSERREQMIRWMILISLLAAFTAIMYLEL